MAQNWLDRITTSLGVVLLNVMLVVGLLQVVSRYITFPIDLNWTYVVARTVLAIMTIIALPYLFQNEADISFLPVLKRVITRTDQVLFVRNILMAFFSATLVLSAYRATGVSGDTALPMIEWFKVGWAYDLIALSAACLLIVVLLDTRTRVAEFLGEANA
ncbi:MULTISPECIES: TRAP transporter small permease subunit [unclassified Haladaptatus]|uniref:TRAP transporter small permease subunit n=1 Tax=unclassified Haladaptatus TaxID=2622732 RepID=UPI00209C1275|nr:MULTISPECIES: TRAP transporter small permease subunit [unclassified Haladaptatus]MCO8244924.1 TRAP transporter small permease subunit [Haladaptatus sp. AB643]MCO8255563.1 TRAP transporter small permease subunit [Haladaptatus sp. AB618]